MLSFESAKVEKIRKLLAEAVLEQEPSERSRHEPEPKDPEKIIAALKIYVTLSDNYKLSLENDMKNECRDLINKKNFREILTMYSDLSTEIRQDDVTDPLKERLVMVALMRLESRLKTLRVTGTPDKRVELAKIIPEDLIQWMDTAPVLGASLRMEFNRL